MPPPGSIRGPHPRQFVPYHVNPTPQPPPPDTVSLRTSIVKQIDYYFRYVLSLFWVTFTLYLVLIVGHS